MDGKNMQTLLKNNNFSQGNLKRLPRESEPNYAIEGILNSVAKIKEEHQLRRNKKKRENRLSEMEIPQYSNTGFQTSRHDEMNTRNMQGFLSPASGHQQRFLKKCTSTTQISNEILSPRIQRKKQNPPAQNKNKKQFMKDKKDSLNVIQQMLSSHICLNNLNSPVTKIKPIKSPRYSEPLIQQNQFQFMRRKKQGESMGSGKKTQEQKKDDNAPLASNQASEVIEDHKGLKETVSTLSSINSHNVKLTNHSQLKITDFEFIKQLGRGKFGCVKLALHKKTRMLYSIKMIKKSVIKEENIGQQIIKQIKIQIFLNHSHIVKLYSIFHDRIYVYLVLEACIQGNLYQQMQAKIKFSQDEGSLIMKSVCQAVAQLHQHQIIHRDLKPENIVFCQGMPKICDFGWSTWLRDSMRETFCGTPLYVSPELLSGQLYDEKVDLWALGIMGYEMMTGSIPFKIRSQKDLCKIVQSKIVYPKWMQSETVDFLQSLLEKDPKARKSLQILLDHPFLNKKRKQ